MPEDLPIDEQFWKELLDHGALNDDLLAEYRQTVAKRPWKPLGRILIDEGILTLRQVAGLFQIQADEPGMRLGDLAVREEYCTVEEIQHALSLQSRTSPGPIELMLRDFRISDENLMDALIGYVHYLEAVVHGLRRAAASS